MTLDRNMDPAPVRWGILGTAQIARKNWQAIALSGNSTVTAVASRDLARCRRFIRECQDVRPMRRKPAAFDSYAELLASPLVDAVYLPLPTGVRRQWVLRAAAAGKHVLCEKPCAASVADLEAMLAVCRRHQVQFMDGVMFMHSRRLRRMRRVLEDGDSVGPIRRITASFTAPEPADSFVRDIRSQPALEPHGCLGDLGWYCIKLILWALDWRLPRQVTARIHARHPRPDARRGVPTEFSAELLFAKGVSAAFDCSFCTGNQQWAVIAGEKGYLRVDDFVLPFQGRASRFRTQHAVYRVAGCDVTMTGQARRFAAAERSNSHPTAQESNLFRTFSDRIRTGAADAFWFETALKTQQVMNACHRAALTRKACVVAR